MNSSIEEIFIPASVTSITAEAFKGCNSLRTVVFDGNVEFLGQKLFEGCTALTTISLPASIAKIPTDLLSYSPNFKQINYSGTKNQWNAIEKSDNWLENAPHFTVICTDGKIEY